MRGKGTKSTIIRRVQSVALALVLIMTVVSPSSTILADSGPLAEPVSGAHGSGSYQLNEDSDDYRFYTEYYVGADSGRKDTTAGIKRRTTINVYAKAGEWILCGSSVSDSEINENNQWTKAKTNKDIVITTPDGHKECKDVLLPDDEHPNGLGYIANHTQEKYGPMVNETDKEDTTGKYYSPLTYKATKSGVYTLEFHSRTGNNDGTTAKVAKVSAGWDQRNTTVAAWDVTVLGEKESSPSTWEVKEGRAWADYLALTTGAAGTTKSDLDVHVLTHDGYVYKVDFNKAVPFGFIFFANNTGFMTKVSGDGVETRMPVYHSFYDATNDLDQMTDKEHIILHKPNEADTSTEETYKIFFNEPSKDLQGVNDQHGNKIKVKPDDNVELSDLKFHGIGENIALSGHGGTFSFHSTGEATIAIIVDLRKAILDSEKTMDKYEGSGIVELTAPAHEGDNTFYWDGKDTDGVVIPSGIYGDQNVVIATEIKRGEIHFPVIDMEGLYGGLCIKRLNKGKTESDSDYAKSAYNLYYNNNPLAYGTIEGKSYPKVTVDKYNKLSDGTKSYNIEASKGGASFFKDYASVVSTLKKDDREYLAQKLFNTPYNSLSDKKKAIIDAEYGKEEDTFHFEPFNSQNENDTMKFSCSDNSGGGNQAGIDAWTYYSQGVSNDLISFAVLDKEEAGIVRGQVFYDGDKNSVYDPPKDNPSSEDYPLANMKVRLIDSSGKPLVHKENLPCFDDSGHFIYEADGTVKHEIKDVEFDTLTDSNGNYKFTGVPYETENDTDYYVQVMLTDTQSEAMRYTCTTSKEVKAKLKDRTDPSVHFHNNTIDEDEYGADGNKIVPVDDITKIYGYKYKREGSDNETVFDFGNSQNTQKVTFSTSGTQEYENGIRVVKFKKIGYCTTVPPSNQKDYKITKKWGESSQGVSTHKISDGLTVELWVWNDSEVEEENTLSLSRRTGALMDTQVLDESNNWSYTWKNLDDRLQYYVLEYYTKKKDNGEIIYNDRHEPRLVLIGGTMPIFGAVPPGKKIYGFGTNLGDYPEQIPDPSDSTKTRIPIQQFENKSLADAKAHANSITKQEKLDSVDNNARQYNVTYKLIKEDGGNTNAIYLTNSQVYDDRTYYVWLDHQTVLPDLIAQTYVNHSSGTTKKESHALTLEKDRELDNGEYSIKGLSVSSVDAALSDNVEGNATDAFRIKENGKSALFTATDHGNYKTGTGTRTYQVKYVVTNDTEKNPVKIKVDDEGKLVLAADEHTQVENSSDYLVYSWYMTIHVYDVKPDDVIEYEPADGDICLQEALPVGKELKWKLIHDDASNENSIKYTSNDTRTKGILKNDTYRVPLYKSAVDPDMGSCADIVGIAYAGDSTVDDVSKLDFQDTYDSRYGKKVSSDDEDDEIDGKAKVAGSGGTVKAILNTTRSSKINRIQDHANYADITFTPKQGVARAGVLSDTDVFYYKVVVFSEDSSYMFYDYDDLDATEGVVMYTYFTLKSLAKAPEVEPTPIPTAEPTAVPSVAPTVLPTTEPSEPPVATTPPPSEEPPAATTPPPSEEPPAATTPPPSELPPAATIPPPSGEPPAGTIAPASEESPENDISGAERDKKDKKSKGKKKKSKAASKNASDSKNDAPDTGDRNNIILWVIINILSLAIIVVLRIKKKSEEKD